MVWPLKDGGTDGLGQRVGHRIPKRGKKGSGRKLSWGGNFPGIPVESSTDSAFRFFRCARRSLAPLAGAIPVPNGVASHREPSLGLVEATKLAKRRQGDNRAVTQVKRFSLVTNAILGPTRSKTGKATVGVRNGEDIGDPGGVQEHGTVGYRGAQEPGRSLMVSQEYVATREAPEDRRTLWGKSDLLGVLRTRESRVHGEAAGPTTIRSGTHLPHTAVEPR